MRVLALDVGGKRIGAAISDERQIIASPLTTIAAEPRKVALARIAALVSEYAVGTVVVGLPLTLRGEIGPQAEEVQRFTEALRRRVEVPITFFDERLSSAEAERRLELMGVKRDRRRQHIDELAAVIILEDYLQHQQGGLPYLLPSDLNDDR